MGRLLCGLALGLAGATAQAEQTFEPHDTAILQAIDKATARVSTVEAPVGDTVSFGTLGLRVRACEKTPPVEQPEAAAFLEIWQKQPQAEQSEWVFSGWMFASSPGVSAMDHPIYDVLVLDCKNPATNAASDPP